MRQDPRCSLFLVLEEKCGQQKKIINLIDDLQVPSCLWDVTSPDYKNRIKKRDAIQELSIKYGLSVSDMEKII